MKTVLPLRLSEWENKFVPGILLTERDRILVDSLHRNSRITLQQLPNGLAIATRSWVGVLQFEHFTLSIHPKLTGDNLQLVNLIEFAAGMEALERHPSQSTLDVTGENLFHLLVLLLADSCERIIRDGVCSDYQEQNNTLPMLRGRLHIRNQILKRFGRLDQLECCYDDYTSDINENRVILAALTACSNRVSQPALSLRIRRLHFMFAEFCEIDDFSWRLAQETLSYNRQNERYRDAHQLSFLILEALGVEDIYTGDRSCFAFMLNMNRLFESFITRWLASFLPKHGFRISSQSKKYSILWHAETNSSYASVIPDVLISRADSLSSIPVDAKYKLYDERDVSSADIYQAFLYAFAFGEEHQIHPTAVLIYPASVIGCAKTTLHVRRVSGSISARLLIMQIHIPSALDAILKHCSDSSCDLLLQLISKVL